MRTTVVCSMLALFCQHCLVNSHILGRPSSTSDLDQLRSLMERFEETLDEAALEESEADYEETNQEHEHGPASRVWSLDQDSAMSEKPLPSAVSRNRAQSQRSQLQNLLMSIKKRASGCFGGRMDRIGNVSGLGCNSGRG
ncbi:natriuretic peptides A [Kryptolebias marmoratus]|uniref:Natriuretic peptide A n=1 Tax=Kryptolebias marmoratus TaxID=37003 RepID=A0A3Q3A740_KRYMA|nr:natriuretic peptides A [Kryptolebias marmoratus]